LVCAPEVDCSPNLALQEHNILRSSNSELPRDPVLCSRRFGALESVDSAPEEMKVDWSATRLPGLEGQ
jgi:hypothetical protein